MSSIAARRAGRHLAVVPDVEPDPSVGFEVEPSVAFLRRAESEVPALLAEADALIQAAADEVGRARARRVARAGFGPVFGPEVA